MRSLLGRAVRWWRRSLQVRVVSSALVASLLVVALVGLLLLDQVANGIFEAQRRAAVAEADSGLEFARSSLGDLRSADPRDQVDARLGVLTGNLASRGGQAGTYDIVLVLANSEAGFASGQPEARSVPAGLRRTVSGSRALAWAYWQVDGQRQLVVGAPLDSPVGLYEIYYFFPLTSQVATLKLVQRTLLVGGLALAVLVAGVAALVARQVVSPVRLAAQTAEQFAGGMLETRMDVHGDDELARLAEAFNGMAAGLQQKIGELETLSRVQRRFVADVSHELRTPLTTVRMASDVLHEARSDFPPAIARSAELLQTELDRFESLLVDLLEISRFDAGAAALDTDVVDLGGIVDRVVEALAPLADRRETEVSVRRPPEPVLVEADQRRVERILRNLMANAIEHSEGQPIVVALGQDDAAVAVSVRDHGVGLQPGESARVFSRFWRADESRARHTGGTGLGLSIAMEDARLHGGWLEAWGSPAQGAVFRLTLPKSVGGELDGSPLPLEPIPAVTGG